MKSWLMALGLMGIPSAFFAQDAEPLQEVVISGFHISDSLMRAPASIGTISAHDLSANNNTEIATAINRIAGVQMQSGSFSTNRISIRGIGGRTPYGTNKIRAFYGNIPLTSGDSETTIEDIDVENLSGAEIIKGPLSSVYGSGLGGAILLRPILLNAHGHSFRISTTHGSFGTHKNSFAYGFGSEKTSVNLSYHRLESDGWRENSAYQRDGVTLGGELFRSEKSKLTYFGNFTRIKAFIPSSIDRISFENNPKAAAANWKSARGFEAYDSFLTGLSYEFHIGKIANATSVYFNHKNSEEARPFDILLQNTNGYGARTQFSGKVAQKLTFLAGAEYFRDSFRSRNLENLYQENDGNGSLAGEKMAESKQNRQFVNVFGQLRWQPFRNMEIQAGINLNKTAFELSTLLPEAARLTQQYEYYLIPAPNLSFLFFPASGTTIYVSASHGFSMPAIEETLTPAGGINPGIKPETGWNFELGSRMLLVDRKVIAEIAAYQMEISNLLVARRTGDDQYVGVNAGKSLLRGIEASLEFVCRLGSELSLHPFASGSFGEYRFREFIDGENDRSGKRIPGVPSAKGNAGLRVDLLDFYLSSEFQYVGEMQLDDANLHQNQSFGIWNFKAGYRWNIAKTVTLDLFGGINNLSDQKYSGMILPNAVTPATGSPRYYYPSNPVNYFAGLRFQTRSGR